MQDELFNDLIGSIREAGAIRRGERLPSRRFRYEGSILVEIEEAGQITWRIDEAVEDLSTILIDGQPDVRALRAALRQTPEGMAALLGISLGTWRGWEQQRRSPRGPARMLLLLAAQHPRALLETSRSLNASESEAA